MRMVILEQTEVLRTIRQMGDEELLEAVDDAIELSDEFLRLIGVDVYVQGGTIEHPNGHLGHTYEVELAETIATGSHYFVNYVERLVDAGYLTSKDLFPKIPLDELDEIKSQAAADGITQHERDFEYAENTVASRLAKLRQRKHWVRRDGYGWYITPEGFAHLDGALFDCEIEIEI